MRRSCAHQRRVAAKVLAVDICTSVEQYAGSPELTIVACNDERCIPTRIVHIDVDPCFDQVFEHFDFALAGSIKQQYVSCIHNVMLSTNRPHPIGECGLDDIV